MAEILYCPKSPDGSLWWGYLGDDKERVESEIAFDEGPNGEFFKWEWMVDRGWSIAAVQLVEIPENMNKGDDDG